MELQLDNGEYQVVFKDANLSVAIEETPLNVIVGENAKIQVEQAIDYIQSGQAEIEEAVQEGIASFDSNATEKTNTYNQNAQEKLSAYNTNAEEKLSAYNSNATEKLGAYNDNASEKLSAYNTNAQNKLDAYNLNDTSKTNAFNQNASDKTDAFNSNATSKTGDFNDNATAKTTAFNENATSKTTAFNENASEKQALVDASAQEASQSANLAKQWAIGDPSEPAGNSAKYWAGQAQAELSGLTSRVSTIEGKIPSSASSSNQLVDKNYVDTEDNNLQTQIDAIVSSSDVFDIVGTYAELQAYDISTVPVNDIIKVLVDSTHGGAATYYRCIETAGVKSWSYIGSEGAYYTKGEADSKFSTIPATGSSLDYTGTTLSLENAQGTVLSSVTIKSTPDLDNTSITLNGSSQLQTVGVINSRDSSTAVKTWTGTKAQYDAIVTKDPNTLYNITDDTDVSLTILEALYPVGSVYITTANTCPLSTLISGSTWELVSSGRVLQGADSGHSAGTTIEAGLPNHNHKVNMYLDQSGYSTIIPQGNAYYKFSSQSQNVFVYNSSEKSNQNNWSIGYTTNENQSNLIYGNSNTVQPPAYVVNIFERTS